MLTYDEITSELIEDPVDVYFREGIRLQISHLVAAAARYTYMHVQVAFMTGLTSLSLENNKIQKLFVGVGQLTLLSELLLDYNELQTLPRAVASLTNLTKLSFAHNKIKHMTEWLLPRVPLRSLNACDNLIQVRHPNSSLNPKP